MSNEIPFHIQEEIIKKLPVVSLLQFRSVSKAWKSLIDSSEFIAAHSVAQPQHLLFSSVDPVNTSVEYICVVDDETFPHQQRFVQTLPLSIKALKHSFLVGSSHGLLCFYGWYGEGEDYLPILETQTVVVWNPSIRKSLTVHVPKKSNHYHETAVGFGVCPVSGHPKIVQILQFINETRYHCEAKVYNVSSGKWTSLSTNLPSKLFHIFSPQVNIDRFIYWCVLDPTTEDSLLPNHNMIMSFDITNENFAAIHLPDSLRRCVPSWLSFSKLRESVVVVEYNEIMKSEFGVWMMENGVENSFTKLFTVEAPDWSRTITLTLMGFRNSGQSLMKVGYVHEFYGWEEFQQLMVYEPNSKRFNDFEIYGTQVYSVSSYMETLVLLDCSDCNSY